MFRISEENPIAIVLHHDHRLFFFIRAPGRIIKVGLKTTLERFRDRQFTMAIDPTPQTSKHGIHVLVAVPGC